MALLIHKLIAGCVAVAGAGCIAYPLSRLGSSSAGGGWSKYEQVLQKLKGGFKDRLQSEKINEKHISKCSAWSEPWEYSETALIVKCDASHYHLYYDNAQFASKGSDDVTAKAKDTIRSQDSTTKDKLVKHHENNFLQILGL